MIGGMLRLFSSAVLVAVLLPPAAASAQVVGADLRASARSDPSRAAVGDDARIVAGVENLGPEQATDVTLTLGLPKGLVAQAVEEAPGQCSVDGEVVCIVGPLAPGASARVRILAGVTRRGPQVATAGVSAQQGDPDTTNNQATAEVSGSGESCGRVGTFEIDRLRAPRRGGVLCGLAGDDVLLGGPRGDHLLGGSGNDSLVGDAGRDRIEGSDGVDACAGDPGPGSVRGCEHDVFALAEALPLVEPSASTVGYGYHQSLFRTAIGLRPFGTHVVMSSRGRGTGSTTAADVVVASRARVRAPVSGEVIGVKRYLLYCERPDWKVAIKPTSDPELRVLVLHMARPTVEDGDEVSAGISLLGRAPANDWPDSQTNRYFPDRYPHVHVEVERDRASPTPGCSLEGSDAV